MKDRERERERENARKKILTRSRLPDETGCVGHNSNDTSERWEKLRHGGDGDSSSDGDEKVTRGRERGRDGGEERGNNMGLHTEKDD